MFLVAVSPGGILTWSLGGQIKLCPSSLCHRWAEMGSSRGWFIPNEGRCWQLGRRGWQWVMCACKAFEYRCKRCCSPWREWLWIFPRNVPALHIILQYKALKSGVIFQPIFMTLLIASCHFSSLKWRFCGSPVFVVLAGLLLFNESWNNFQLSDQNGNKKMNK